MKRILALIALASLFCLQQARAEGTFELRQGVSTSSPIYLEGSLSTGNVNYDQHRVTFLRVDIFDPATEVIDLFGQALSGSPDVQVWCPGRIPLVTPDAPYSVPTPDFTADFSAGNGALTSFADLQGVQSLPGTISPQTYSLGGASASCGTAGVYTIRYSSAGIDGSGQPFFDIRVRDTAASTIERGRVWADKYAFSMTNSTGRVGAELYVVAGIDRGADYLGIVWLLDLNDIAPFGFQLYANERGVGPAQYNYQSIGGSASPAPQMNPQYPIYLNPPAKPVTTPGALGNIEAIDTQCVAGGATDVVFRFDTAGALPYTIRLDENQDMIFDLTEVIAIGTSSDGTNTVVWDGTLPSGASIPSGTTYQIELSLTTGEVHFPFYDVEDADPGPVITPYSVGASATTDLYYWDDSDPSITSTSGGGTTSGPNGTLSTHNWANGVNSYNDANMIDTWKYADVQSIQDVYQLPNSCVAAPEIGLAKDAAITADNGDGTVELTLDFRIENMGNIDLQNVQISDDIAGALPSPVTWTIDSVTTSATLAANGGFDGSADTDLLDAATSTLPLGEVGTVSLVLDVDFNGETGPFTNTADVSADDGTTTVTDVSHAGTDPDPDGNGDPGDPGENDPTPLPVAESDLDVTKVIDDANPLVDDTVTWTITVTNNGPVTETDAQLTDVLPAAFSPDSITPSAGSWTAPVWTLPTLLPGQAETLTVTGSFVIDGSFTNVAELTDATNPDPDSTPGNGQPSEDDQASSSVVVDPLADLSITKTDGSATYVPGGIVTYTIVVANAGPSDVTGAGVDDVFPAQLSGVTWTCSGSGASCPNAAGAGDISETVDLPAGASLTYTATGTASSSATGNLVNTASVTVPAGVTDPDGGNNSATDTDTPDPTADLTITKTDGSATYSPGGSVTYTIVVGNAGPSDVTGADVDDSFPAALSGVTWTCAGSGGASCPNASGSGDIAETVNLPAGGSLTYTASASVSAGATGDLINTATVTPSAGVTDPDGGNNAATDTDTVEVTADLSVTKTDGSATYTPGGGISYTIVVANAGPSNVTGATLADTFPAVISGVTWTCSGSGGASCPNASGAGDLAETVDLPNGGSLTYTASGTVLSSATGNLVNTASVTPPAGVTDPDGGNNSGSDTSSAGAVADLSVTKTDGSATYTPGGSTTYTIVVGNAGPSDVFGALVSDAFPAVITGANWTCAGSGGASCPSASGSGGLAETVDIPVGGSLTYSVDASISSAASGNLVNTASVAVPPGTSDPVGGNNSATDTDTPDPSADLSITKTDGSATYTPGGPITYTIVASNAGPSDALGANVSDAFPADISGVTWTCAGSGGASCPNASGSGDIGETVDLPAGSSLTYTASGSVSAGATGNLSNTAAVTSPAGVTDPDGGNNSATDTDTVEISADLSVTKTDGSATYTPGGAISYTIVVSNAGPSNVFGAAFADTLPADLTGATWTCAGAGGASCPAASGTGDLSEVVDLPSGGSLSYTLNATVASDATGNLVNTASITAPAGTTDPDGTNNTATDTDTASPQADLSITKTDGSATYTPGGSTTYTIVVGNAGPSDVFGALVSDAFPAAITGANWTCAGSGGASCPSASGSGDLAETVDIPVGGSLTYSVDASISSAASGNLVNTASVAVPPGTSDPVGGNNSATDTDTPDPSGDLSITKTDGSATYTPGGSVTYTITVQNAGPSDAVGASVTDAFPPQLSGVTWTCAGSGGAACPSASGTGDIAETVDVPAGGSLTYVANASISNGASGDLINTANVTPPAGLTDPDGGNNSSTDTDTASPEADLSVTKTDGSATYTPGGSITYVIDVANAGPSNVVGATFSDALPAELVGATWTCAAAGGASCPNASGSGDLSEIVDIPSGGSLTYTVAASIASNATGNLVNTASITPPAGVTDPDGGNNSSTDTDTADASADLSVTKTDGSATYTPGGAISYSIVVQNAGPSDVFGASFSDTLPADLVGATWTCAGAGGASCPNASGSGDLAETLDIPSSGSLTYTVNASVASDATGDLVNTATIAAPAGTTDPDGSNNSATDTDTASPEADLSVTKTDGSATYTPGGSLTYTIGVSNAGPSDVVGAAFSDTLPPELNGATWTCTGAGGASCPSASGSGDLAETVDIPSGGSLTYTVDANVASDASGDLVNTATIAAPAGVTDSDGSNNSATDTDTADASADLSVTKTDGSPTYTPGDPITYTITVQNAGPSDVVGASFSDTLPAELDAATWTCAGAGGASCPSASGSGDLAETVDIPSGGSLTYTVDATVASDATGDLVNTATIAPPAGTTDPDGGNNSATDTDTADASADLAVVKTVAPEEPEVGDTVTFTIQVDNNGPSDATGVTVNDPLPAGYSFQSANADQGSYSAPDWTVGALSSGASATLTIEALVTDTDDYLNVATVSGDQPDPDSSNDTDDASIRRVELQLEAICVNNAPYVNYTVTPLGFTPGSDPVDIEWVTQDGSATVAETLNGQPLSGQLLWPGAAVDGSGNGIDWPGWDFVGGEWIEVDDGLRPDMLVRVDVNPQDELVVSYPAATPDCSANPPVADLSITKDDGEAVAVVGGSVTYTIEVTNDGPSNADNVLVDDPTPPGLVFSANTGACTTAFPCSLGTLDVDESVTIQATYDVPIDYAGADPILNTASVTTDSQELDATDNSASDDTPVLFDGQEPVIGLAKSLTELVNGELATVSFGFTVENLGNVPLNNVQVTDDLAAAFAAPAAFSIDSVSATGGLSANPAYDGQTDVALLDAGGSSLAIGETATITLTLTLDLSETADRQFENGATATATGPIGQSTTDASNNGLVADPDGNGDPTPPAENVPTPIDLRGFQPFAVPTLGFPGLLVLMVLMVLVARRKTVARPTA